MTDFPIYCHTRYDAVMNEDGKLHLTCTDVSDHDFVEVVRCKDCRFSEKNSGFLSCDFFNIWNVKQDGFCSYGEWRIKNG
jgi:hypothetical protein